MVSAIELRVLAVLRQRAMPMPPGAIGCAIWPKPWERGEFAKPQHYARPAGKILRRLQGRGLVDYVGGGGDGWSGWIITAAGAVELTRRIGK